MKVTFDDRAIRDLESIYQWIVQDNSTAAKAVVERIFASTELLGSFPHMATPRLFRVKRYFRSDDHGKFR